MADNYRELFNKLLKSKEDTFDITQTLYQQVNNEYWREKSNLWSIISAACNEAAGDFYIKLREYVKNLADIDVCNIHSLKSIAQSVDAPHLLDFVDNIETFPVELRLLLDILSIKPSKLLEANQKLNVSALLPLYGNIDRRSCLYRPLKLSPSLLNNIIGNIDKIEKWFEYNVILPNATLKYIFDEAKLEDFSNVFVDEAKMYNENLKDDSTVWLYGYNERIDAEKEGWYEPTYITLDDVLYLKVQDVFNNIRNLKEVINLVLKDRERSSQLIQKLAFEFKYSNKDDKKDVETFLAQFYSTPSIVVEADGKYVFNPFFALIEIVKSRLFASQNGLPMLSYYKEKGDNEVTIDMADMFESMVSIIKNNDSCYIQNYMLFHIYNLFYNRIINDNLKNDFEIKQNTTTGEIDKITYVSKYSPMTYEEFYPQVSAWISNNELKEFLGQHIELDVKLITNFKEIEVANKVEVTHFNKDYINFIQYLSLVNAITGVKDELNYRLPYLIYRYNNNIFVTNDFNQYYRNLVGIDDNGNYTSNNLIEKVAKYLTDVCIKVSYIRLEIKALVQQYSFIGTLRIISDVVRDYYVKNFSKRSSWRYVSDIFKNKDNTPYLKTIELLNGADENSQFNAQIIEYFDQTDYLNILTDLPYVINGYNSVLTTITSTYITDKDQLSTYILDKDITSTVYDDLGLYIPSSLYPSPSMASSITIPAVTTDASELYSAILCGAPSSPTAYNQTTQTITTAKSEVNITPPISSTTFTINTPLSTLTEEEANAIEPLPTFRIYYTLSAQLSEENYNTIAEKVTSYLISSVVVPVYETATEAPENWEAEGWTKLDDEDIWERTRNETRYCVIAKLTSPVYVDGINSNIATTASGTQIITDSATVQIPTVDTTQPYQVVITPSSTSILLSPLQTFEGEFYNSAASSITIPKGTSVSALIPAGTEITVDIPSTLQVANWVKGNELALKANARFWLKNLDYLGYEDLSSEISFYLKYFTNLANAGTLKAKLKVYKEEVYPLLSSIWDTFATSGMNSDGNEEIHKLYTGKYPGTLLEKNIGNQSYTTIAPLPYIPNLIEANEYDNDDSYIVKPLYDNIAYYMNMFMAQMFNMYNIQAENGLAIAVDGWKQTHIELKGYCSRYERMPNTISTEGLQNSKLDYDGPWVYSSLKAFLSLVKDGNITKEEIKDYVNNFFFNLTTLKVRKNTINKLYRFRNDIIAKGNGEEKLYSFEYDENDNQFSLFKRKDYFKYEDVGLIWVRMKNFPLSIPLMNKNVAIDFMDVKYQNDIFDTLLYNLSPKYANMLKQMANNAVQFGVIKNVMWILGWTNYTFNVNDRLTFNDTLKVLKLVSFRFKPREDFVLLVDPQTINSYHLDLTVDRLNNFNLFVGVNYKLKSNSIDFILYNRNKENFKVFNYSLADNVVNEHIITYDTSLIPALQIEKIEALILTNKDSIYLEEGHTYNFNYGDGECYGLVYSDDLGKYYISGYMGLKDGDENLKTTIYDCALHIEKQFNYYIVNATPSSMPELETILLELGEKNIVTTPFISLVHFDVDPIIDLTNVYTRTKITDYANIWRVGADLNNTGIAYLAYDFKGKELLKDAECFAWDNNSAENQKTLNNILAFSGLLLTKQVIDSNNNVVYLNQIKTLSSEITSSKIYFNEYNKGDYIATQLAFPYCYLNTKNQLCISSLITTLGGYKSLTVDKTEKYIELERGDGILTVYLNSSIQNYATLDLLLTNDLFNNFDRYLDDRKVTSTTIYLNLNLDDYKNIFSGLLTGTYDFYKYYDQYIEAKLNDLPLSSQKKLLDAYNELMSKLNDVVKFAPVINDFLVEPLKVIFNFGNKFDFDINQVNPNYTNYFDLDINLFIDNKDLKYKKVGWKCGLWQTDYINWISRDLRFGSPEIVAIDIDKYKNKYITRKNMNDSSLYVDIIINTCWFSLSIIQSLNPSIFVNWKGFTYHYLVEDILTNQGCCDFPFLKVRVGLNNNTLYCYRKVLVPVCAHNKHTDERLFGFIRVWEDLIGEEQLTIKSYIETEDVSIDIDWSDTFRNYLEFELVCKDKDEARRLLRLVGIYIDSLSDALNSSLNWNKTTILNIEDQLFLFHIKKIIIL